MKGKIIFINILFIIIVIDMFNLTVYFRIVILCYNLCQLKKEKTIHV